MTKTPTPEQLTRIQEFAAANGAAWKAKLNDAWQSGRDADESRGYLLRQVRNTLGPRWLVKFKL